MRRIDGSRSSASVGLMGTMAMLFRLRFFAEIRDVDRQDSTRVRQLGGSRVVIGRLDEVWQKKLQVFRRNRLANFKQGIEGG